MQQGWQTAHLAYSAYLGMLKQRHGWYLVCMRGRAVQLVQLGYEAAGVTLVGSQQVSHQHCNLCICHRCV